MKIAFLSSEAVPFASSGGLGDVVAALPEALHATGVETLRILPLYRSVRERGIALEDTGIVLSVPLSGQWVGGAVRVHREAGVPTYFIEHNEFFDREGLYGPPGGEYDDTARRFIFFQKAAVALLEHLGGCDIVHCNDWQTGFVPLFLTYGLNGQGRTRTERCVFTIHNLAYQGHFSFADFALTNLPPDFFSMDGVEFYGGINSMKAGIHFADVVTTVSETYAREITTPAFGCGLEGVLASLGEGRLVGILNGVDYARWDPGKDPLIPAGYTWRKPDGKKACRRALGEAANQVFADDHMVIGMVSRLAGQKGFDLLEEAISTIMDLPVAVVLLGTGEQRYHALATEWENQWPGRFTSMLTFDNMLAHLVEAGSDAFLMPSVFEPCGLNQLYSLRYGTLPIVNATGGLEDTVQSVTHGARRGNGFKFSPYAVDPLVDAVNRAVELFADQEAWTRVMRRAMRQDFSWAKSAEKYRALYERLEG